MGAEVSHDNVIITEVKNMVEVRWEIGGTTKYRADVNIMNVDGSIVDGGCNGEMLTDVVGGEKWVGKYVDERNGVMNEWQILHHPCHQAGPYGQRCSLEKHLVEALWLI